ncbi:hypothetical protein [Cyclobacterium xiamenense]|uniref:hypothetical protein n=1 Tax=Cyclobacterium xiamenense TaxID=1297121 RepID=UPI0012B6BD81|nr:hypothetical protein [Cyclobacterium xiamenense]
MNQTTNGIVRQRLSLLLVLLFCTFVSVSELTVQLDADSSLINLQFDLDDDAAENDAGEEKTFIHAAIDAVVPFALVVVDHAYHLIYEVSGGGNLRLGFDAGSGPPFNQLFEILFEQIISVNAP